MPQPYDIVIVGSGMVGASLARALTGSGLRVAVVEARPPVLQWDAASRDVRVSALTLASVQFLANLGAWDEVAAERVSPYREMHVWDPGGGGSIHFDSAEIGEPQLGYIVENRVVQKALVAPLLSGGAEVDWLCPYTVEAIDPKADAVHITLDRGETLAARLLVGADGSQSQVRSLAGIGTQGWNYGQTAVVATVRTERHHNETAWQCFLGNGPLAFLPLTEGYCSIVWSTTPAHADALLAMDEPQFLTALHQAFGDRLGRMLTAGPRASFALRMLHARAYTQPRLALIGDAAHTIHPLAGQGVNLGFADAATLAQVLIDALPAQRDPGVWPLLRRYERWRKGDNVAMIALMEGFKRLFGSRAPIVRWARNTGLGLFDAAGPLKALIMRHATGLSGDLPALARPRPARAPAGHQFGKQ